jgi:putative transcriptional regulator
MEILDLRKQLKLNQVQFAQLFGVHQMTASRWERGELAPTPYHQALMDEFRKAAKDREAQEKLEAVLIGAGVIAAVYLLLSIAKRG